MSEDMIIELHRLDEEQRKTATTILKAVEGLSVAAAKGMLDYCSEIVKYCKFTL